MPKHTACQHGIRNHVHKKEQYWRLHISRSVAPGQTELESEFEKLKVFNGDIIKFKKFGELGLTLVMVEHLLHDIFDMSPHEKIPRKKLTEFAAELNSIDEINLSGDLHVVLADKYNPYCVNGSRYFGLQVKSNEELTEGRKAIIDYVSTKYEISKHKARNRLKSLDPHITLGSIILKDLDRYDRNDLFNNPNGFIDNHMREHQYKFRHYKDGPPLPEIPVFPEKICLNGIVVAAKAAR